jgi:RecA-family ATPase
VTAQTVAPNPSVPENDEALLAWLAAQHGRAFHKLLVSNERREFETPSEPEFDAAVFVAQNIGPDPERIKRVLLKSARVRPKWDERHPMGGTYLDQTIRSAIVRAQALTKGQEERRLHAYSDVEILALPDPEWLIDGLLLKGGLCLLVGRYGAGKSFLAIDWAMHIAAGMAWQDRAVQRGPVLYVYGEGSLKTRVAAWRSAHRIEPGKALGVAFAPGTVNLLEEASVTRLLEWIGDQKPIAIVLDTLSRMTPGGDENDSETAGRLIAATGRIQRETGAAVMLLHHTP